MFTFLQRLDDTQFVFRINPSVNRDLLHGPVQCVVRHLVNFRARERPVIGANAQLFTNNSGGNRVVAGDHHRADTRLSCLGHGFFGFFPRRVDHADQAYKHQILLKVFIYPVWLEVGCGYETGRHAQCAQGFRRQVFVGQQDVGTALWR